jgi:hypothetical protein
MRGFKGRLFFSGGTLCFIACAAGQHTGVDTATSSEIDADTSADTDEDTDSQRGCDGSQFDLLFSADAMSGTSPCETCPAGELSLAGEMMNPCPDPVELRMQSCVFSTILITNLGSGDWTSVNLTCDAPDDYIIHAGDSIQNSISMGMFEVGEFELQVTFTNPSQTALTKAISVQ